MGAAYPWDQSVTLMIDVHCELGAKYVAGAAQPLPVMTLRLSAPAIHLLAVLAGYFAPLMQTAPRRVLSPDQTLTNLVARRLHRRPPFQIP
jgi:hypothetical protein